MCSAIIKAWSFPSFGLVCLLVITFLAFFPNPNGYCENENIISTLSIQPRLGRITHGEFAPEENRLFVNGLLSDVENEPVIRILREIGSNLHCIPPQFVSSDEKCNFVFKSLAPQSEARPGEFLLRVTPKLIYVQANDMDGRLNAVRLVEEILRKCDSLPCLEINDWPSFRYRGFHLDVSRGRIPNRTNFMALVDEVSRNRGNLLLIYMEHLFLKDDLDENTTCKSGLLSEEHLRWMDDYCAMQGVQLVPAIQTLGHLGKVLSEERFRHLGEVPLTKSWHEMNFSERMRGGTINPDLPESRALITTQLTRLMPLFRSEFVMLCCDEPFDLRSEAGPPLRKRGKRYSEYLQFLTETATELEKSAMVWGDVVAKDSTLESELPSDLWIVGWDYYRNPDKEVVSLLRNHSARSMLCTGALDWRRFLPDVQGVSANVLSSVRVANDLQIQGFLVASWGDYGGFPPPSTARYGLILGLSSAWNSHHTILSAMEERWRVEQLNVTTEIYETLRAQMESCRDIQSWQLFLSDFETPDLLVALSPNRAYKLQINAKLSQELLGKTLEPMHDDIFLMSQMNELLAIKYFLTLELAFSQGLNLSHRQRERYIQFAHRIRAIIPEYRKNWLRDSLPHGLADIERELNRVANEAEKLALNYNVDISRVRWLP